MTRFAILNKINKPLKFEKLSLPELKSKQLLIKIKYSGICRSQIMEIMGLRGKDKYLPHALGHEASGIVLKVGKNVKKFKKRDEVILSWIKSKSKDSEKIFYYNKKKKINSGFVSTFSTHSIVSENRVFKKPKKLSFKNAALYGCAVPTGAGIVINQVKPKKKDSVILIGLGGIGIISLITLNCLGVKNIIVIENNIKKIKLLRFFKIKKFFLNFKKKNINEIIKLTNGGAKFCIETAGHAKTIEMGLKLINKTGKLVFASHPEFKKKIKINPYDLILGKKIIGSWGGNSNLDKQIKSYYNLFKKKNKYFNLILKKIYKFSDINKAIRDLKNGKCLRPIIKM
jgi:Zn-dependent alcohol dehydrogenase